MIADGYSDIFTPAELRIFLILSIIRLKKVFIKQMSIQL